jgi:uncharacterized circularly permuted ATP-grasp superfamily protein
MWLLDNRVQSPSGSGYALENRIVMANVFPQTYKNIHRGKLSPYFTELQKRLENLVAVLKIQMWFFYRQEQAMKPILSMFIFLPT